MTALRLRRTSLVSAVAVGAALALSAVPASAQTGVVTFFDFNDGTNNPVRTADPGFVSDRPLPANSVITTDFPAGNSVAFLASGTTVNADPDDGGPEPPSLAGNSLAFNNGTLNADGTFTSNNGRFLQFNVSTFGFTNLLFDYAAQTATGGFTTNELQYSVNSGSFMSAGSRSLPTPDYQTVLFDLSAINEIENQSQVTFRLIFSGASTSFEAPTNLDNLTLTGVTAVPEPGTMTLMGLGLAGLIGGKLRRRRQEATDATEAETDASATTA